MVASAQSQNLENAAPTQDEIEKRTYELNLMHPLHGHDPEDWFAAEAEMRQLRAGESTAKAKPSGNSDRPLW